MKFYRRWKYGVYFVGVFFLLSRPAMAGSSTNDPQQEQQLRGVFAWPAQFAAEPMRLNAAQVKAAARGGAINVRPEHRAMTIYKASVAGNLKGYVGYFQVKEPDGKLCPAAVGVGPEGTIKKVAVFSRVENNPLAKDDFLKQFTGLKVADSHDWHLNKTIHLLPQKEQDSLDFISKLQSVGSVIVESKGLPTE